MSTFADALASLPRQKSVPAQAQPSFADALAGIPAEPKPFAESHPVLSALGNVGIGALKGAGQTIGALDNTRAGKWLNSFGGMRSKAATQADTDAYNALTTPHGVAQNIGAAGENVAEGFALPEVKGARLPLRLAAQAGIGSGLSAAHGGSGVAGAIMGGAGEGLGSALKAVAPKLAEAGIGARAVDRQYGMTPGAAVLNDTRGIKMGTLAKSARAKTNELTSDIEGMAKNASKPITTVTPNYRQGQKLLTDGKAAAPEVEHIPLHGATAVVDRPAMLQPAMAVRHTPDQVIGRVGSPPVGPVSYRTATALENIPGATSRTAQDAANLARAEHLGISPGNTSEFVRPGNMGDVEHPDQQPFRTVRSEERAQGVMLRKKPSPPPAPSRSLTPEELGVHINPRRDISIKPMRNFVEGKIAETPPTHPSGAKDLQYIHDLLTGKASGTAIPENLTPWEALQAKRGLGKEMVNFGMDRTRDTSTGSQTGKQVYHMLDSSLDKHLGPEFSSKNQRISSLIPAGKAADRASRSEPLSGRVLHRIAAHTGALVGAGTGADIGYRRGGVGGAIAGGLTGAVLPEVIASRPGLIAAARAANSPITKRLIRGGSLAAAAGATRQ